MKIIRRKPKAVPPELPPLTGDPMVDAIAGMRALYGMFSDLSTKYQRKKLETRVLWVVVGVMIGALVYGGVIVHKVYDTATEAKSSGNCLRQLLTERATLTSSDNKAAGALAQAEVDWHTSLTKVLNGGDHQPPSLYASFLKADAHYNIVSAATAKTLHDNQEIRRTHPLNGC